MRRNLASILLVAAVFGAVSGCDEWFRPHPKPKPEELPAITLSAIDVKQGERKTVNLATLANDSGITWEKAESDNPELVNLSVSGEELTLAVSDNIIEDVSYSGKLTAKRGNKEESVSISGTVGNIVDIYGSLKNNETESNEAGLIKLFDSIGSKIGESSTSNGNFGLTSSLRQGKAKLQARLNNGYVRTIELSLEGKDISGIEIYAVPKVDFDLNDDEAVNEKDSLDFIEFMKQINTTYSYENGIWFSCITKFDLNNLTAIEICRTNSNKGISFNQTAIDNAIGYFSDPDNIPVLIAGKKNLSSIIQTVENSSSAHIGQQGYISIIPDDITGTKGGTGLDENFYQSVNGRLVTSSVIHALPENELFVAPHEIGHSFIAQVLVNENNQIISPKNTFMYSGTAHPVKPGLADEKAGNLLYKGKCEAGQRLDYLLEMKFLDNSN
jgi:hypothetical protein